MIRCLALVAVVPLLLLVAACGPTPQPSPTDTTSSTPAADPTPMLTPLPGVTGQPVVQEQLNADDFLLEGGLNVDTDGDGFWSAHYGFYFEPTKSARCDIFIFSGDDPAVSCSIVPGDEAKVSYALPADAQCDYSTSNPHDGYTLALGSKGLYPAVAGFSGCQDPAAAGYFTAETKVLGEGKSIVTPPFTCVVNGGAAGCSYLDDSGSIIFSPSTAAHAG